MSLFSLDSGSVFARVQSSGKPPVVPSLGKSVISASLFFCLASLVVFGSWAFWGNWMYGNLSEPGAYAVWAGLFILLAGGALNGLVIGPRTLGRFYALFLAAFGAYALVWSVSWFAFGGRTGEWLGSLAGTMAMGVILASAFGLGWGRWRMIGVLFVTHSAGYFLGGFLFEFVRSESGAELLNGTLDRRSRSTVAKLLWGAAYGLGLGAGLGFALHACQARIRDELQLDRLPLAR